jgi:hypothetical protein
MSDTKRAGKLSSAITRWLKDFPGEMTCALQIWYEGLGGMGTPNPAEIAAIEEVMAGAKGWEPAGNVRYEKMGQQPSFKRKPTNKAKRSELIMVQHMFKVNSLYRSPDGRVFKVVLSEVYNLRCFEVANGNLVGGMIKIHPTSDFAKSLIEV